MPPTAKLWHTRDRAFAIPTDFVVPPGEVEVRCGLRRAFVDLDAIEPFAVDAEQARALARSLVADALRELSGALPTGSSRADLPDVLAAALRTLVEAARDPVRQAAVEQRIAAARARHLDENAALAEARLALQQALADATPLLAEHLAAAAAKIRRATDRTRRP